MKDKTLASFRHIKFAWCLIPGAGTISRCNILGLSSPHQADANLLEGFGLAPCRPFCGCWNATWRSSRLAGHQKGWDPRAARSPRPSSPLGVPRHALARDLHPSSCRDHSTEGFGIEAFSGNWWRTSRIGLNPDHTFHTKRRQQIHWQRTETPAKGKRHRYHQRGGCARCAEACAQGISVKP